MRTTLDSQPTGRPRRRCPWFEEPQILSFPNPPGGTGGRCAMFRALGAVARSPAVLLVLLAALVYLFGERSSETIAAATDRIAEAIAAVLP
jgi:hypothetical protein